MSLCQQNCRGHVKKCRLGVSYSHHWSYNLLTAQFAKLIVREWPAPCAIFLQARARVLKAHEHGLFIRLSLSVLSASLASARICTRIGKIGRPSASRQRNYKHPANEEAHVASIKVISPASCPTDTSRLAFGNTPTKSQTPKHWSTTPLVHAFLHHLSLDPTISILDQRHRKKVDTSRNLKTDLETASRPRLERAVQNISQICA